MDPAPTISTEALTVRRGGREVLHRISLAVSRPAIVDVQIIHSGEVTIA